MTEHPLQQRVRSVSARARLLRWGYALAAVLAGVVGAMLVWGLLDYALHVQESGVRAIATLAILAVAALVVWKFAWPACVQQASDLATAQHIEQRFPELGDRLSSALAFLSQDEHDAQAGSPVLRRAVIADAAARTEPLDFGQAVNHRPTLRMAALAGVLCLVAAILIVIHPAAARLVLLHTINPWTSAAWPRRHQLVVAQAPRLLATGSDFEITVADEGEQLPQSVTISYWFDGDRPDQAQQREMKRLGERMVHRLENVTRSFKYRVFGGDDDTMPWQDLAVLEPPHVMSLAVQLFPPAYTGWPSLTVAPDFRALEGSRIELQGELDMPVETIKLIVEGAAEPLEIPLALAAEGRSFSIDANAAEPWILSPANSYHFEFTSAEGITGGTETHYELSVVPDRPAAVVVEQPADNLLVTPNAVLPLRALVKDDLAVHTIELKYLASNASEAGEKSISLFAGPAQVAAAKVNPLSQGNLPGASQLVEFQWNLAEVPGLEPGVTLTWHVAAEDYRPQVGLSSAQRVVIITREQFEDRVAQRQSAILMQLQEVLRQQQAARSGLTGIETQLDSVGRLEKQDLDQLQSVELQQRQVQRGLTSETDGLLAQVQALLAELAHNQADSPDVTRRMTQLATEIKRLGTEPLPVVARELTSGLKIVRNDLDEPGREPQREATANALATAGGAQDEVIASLEALLGELSEWENYRRFAREVSRLRSDQEALRRETQAAQPQTLGKNLRDLASTEVAALRRLGQRQTELSRQFDKLVGRMGTLESQLSESQPLAAEAIADAIAAAKRLAISSQMLETSREIERNQLGSAGQQQEEVADSLAQLLDILSNRTEHELGRRLKQLRAAATELTEVQRQLERLARQARAASEQAEPTERQRQLERLTKEHNRLAEEAERLARRLERLEANEAGASVSQGGDKIGEAGQSSQQGNGQKTLEDLAQGKQNLDEAQRQLQQKIAQTEQDLFFEQVAKLEQAIEGLVKRQQAVIDETVRLENLKSTQDGEWTPSQRTSVGSLTAQQRDLLTETTAFAQKLASAEAFSLALAGSVREMTRAAARLERLLTDTETQTAEQVAVTRLSQLLEALQPEPPPDTPPEQEPGGSGGGGQPPGMPPGDALHLLAELKLLKLMQAEINRRTKELEVLQQSGTELTPDQQQELADLATEQGQLADLALNLGEKSAASTGANPPEPAPQQPPDENRRPGVERNIDEELNRSLDNELLPGGE